MESFKDDNTIGPPLPPYYYYQQWIETDYQQDDLQWKKIEDGDTLTFFSEIPIGDHKLLQSGGVDYSTNTGINIKDKSGFIRSKDSLQFINYDEALGQRDTVTLAYKLPYIDTLVINDHTQTTSIKVKYAKFNKPNPQ